MKSAIQTFVLQAFTLVCIFSLASATRAALLTPTSVSFSGADPGTTEFFPLVNIVNDSGLSGVATEFNFNTITHLNASGQTAWTTDDPAPGGGDYYVEGPGNPEITFTLDQEYDLTDVVIWGYHFGSPNGNELTGFDVTVTGSGGSIMVPGLTRAISAANATATSFGSTLTGHTVTLTLTDNGFGTGPAGGDRVGIGEVKFLTADSAVGFEMVIDRSTGSIKIENNSTKSFNVSSIQLDSTAGSLVPANWLSIADNYDANSGPVFIDPDDIWNVTSNSSLSIAESTSGSATLAPNDSVDYGTTWAKSPFEDVTFSIQLDDGTTFEPAVRYTGNGDAAYAIGDLNFDGVIDALDWPIYRDGYRQDMAGMPLAQSYGLGDLNGDGINNYVDYGLFESIYDSANGGGAFQAMIQNVPEPSTGATLVLGMALLFGLRRRRNTAVALLLATFFVSAAMTVENEAHAQFPSVVANWTLDSDATDSVGAFDGFDSDVTYGQPGANANTGTAAAFDGVFSFIDVSFDTQLNPDSYTVALWAQPNSTAGYQSPITSRDDVIDVTSSSTHGYIIYNGSDGNWQHWTGPGVPGWNIVPGGPVATGVWTHLAATFDKATNFKGLYVNGVLAGSSITQGYSPNGTVQLENLHIGSGGDFGDEFLFDGLIDDVAVFDGAMNSAEITNVMNNGVSSYGTLRMTLEVNTTNGQSRLVNETGQTLDLDQYEVLSASNSLSPTSWNSLQDQDYDGSGNVNNSGDGWEELGVPSSGFLGEAFLLGSSTLNAGQSISLGGLYATNIDAQDLTFGYHEKDTGAFFPGTVRYVSGGIDGDFDDNSDYDCGDIDALASDIAAGTNTVAIYDLTGDGLVTIADLNAWRAEAGAAELASANPYLVGDDNLNGVVDSADLGRLLNNFGTINQTSYCGGDLDANGSVSSSDLGLLLNNFGAAAAMASSVPEPDSMGVLLFMSLLTIARCKRTW